MPTNRLEAPFQAPGHMFSQLFHQPSKDQTRGRDHTTAAGLGAARKTQDPMVKDASRYQFQVVGDGIRWHLETLRSTFLHRSIRSHHVCSCRRSMQKTKCMRPGVSRHERFNRHLEERSKRTSLSVAPKGLSHQSP